MAADHTHTRDLDEAIETVGQVYCQHQLQLHARARSIDTTLDISGSARQPVVRLRYGAPVIVDAGRFPDLFLIMRSTGGQGSVRQGRRQASWTPGGTVPVSPNVGTEFDFGADFSQTTVKPDKQKLEALCSRWIGHPLEETLRFELAPFSSALERTWSSTLALLEGGGSEALSAAAEASLEEFLLTVLLQQHPHNYSDELASPPTSLPPRLVRQAERYIQEHADQPLTVAEVARSLGVSIRALQAGFQACRNTTPMGFLRQVRTERVRQALLQADASTTVTELALRHGFFHLGRFSAHYKARFGESPMATLSRARKDSLAR
ncbi:AraC family transcriptional regulator [Variovorax saccharolyticus]|uniref:AraC family transcriptional regulator n=1 Tax=Variovorax saccharolyticus TaxID=3053516 RepID=UPI0025767C20|nr:AraC family transcriptional regulator [Variovorax sp. J22R187]MDM0019093.1 AraC family transcriptional regulator [Variovorax sp. J22R187]